ncbi:cuticle protein, putative [Ixodes scapularis]|uniref:Cuticle protein, putative n=1 Tax=Ixodes scapularis TaxID=6945 RepID=B7PBS1_IXOSC|nr:cuticle protein, putative [Ixodes scapularis]|eukprot:XP_002408819.1 cuticle protein, putative [Ixodes scapularis]
MEAIRSQDPGESSFWWRPPSVRTAVEATVEAPAVTTEEQEGVVTTGEVEATAAPAAPVATVARDRPTPYEFGYDVKDEYGNSQSRQESGDGSGTVKGSYGYTDTNGIYRQVSYVADANGFRATVKTNEPGVGPASPADAEFIVEPPPAGVVSQEIAVRV